MIGLDGATDADMNLRAAALKLAVDAYDPDTVMVAAPDARDARVLPAAEEIVETAKVFEAYLRGPVDENTEPEETAAGDEDVPPPCGCTVCVRRRNAEVFQKIAAAARRLDKPEAQGSSVPGREWPAGLAELIIGGEDLNDHLARCRGCRSLAATWGFPVPPWMGGRSGG